MYYLKLLKLPPKTMFSKLSLLPTNHHLKNPHKKQMWRLVSSCSVRRCRPWDPSSTVGSVHYSTAENHWRIAGTQWLAWSWKQLRNTKWAPIIATIEDEPATLLIPNRYELAFRCSTTHLIFWDKQKRIQCWTHGQWFPMLKRIHCHHWPQKRIQCWDYPAWTMGHRQLVVIVAVVSLETVREGHRTNKKAIAATCKG